MAKIRESIYLVWCPGYVWVGNRLTKLPDKKSPAYWMYAKFRQIRGFSSPNKAFHVAQNCPIGTEIVRYHRLRKGKLREQTTRKKR